jgi:hypothetical protein
MLGSIIALINIFKYFLKPKKKKFLQYFYSKLGFSDVNKIYFAMHSKSGNVFMVFFFKIFIVPIH